jgi:hypothetical protein
MTAIRFIEAPTRRPGESGRAFIDRMLAELNNTGGATALPTPPKIEITATTAKVDKSLEAKPQPVPESEVVDVVHGPFPVKECRGKITASDAPLDWRGRPDYRPTTKSWPPGPMGPDGRSTHRYVGAWPPRWASKWTTGKSPK